GVISCRTSGEPSAPLLQPGAPGEATTTISAAEASDLSAVGFREADVKFMQGMIGHHSQALEMVELLPSRTSREDMKLLAQRILVSQEDEIQMMQDWLRARGQSLPEDRKSTRLNSSHVKISYAVFCLKKKKQEAK